MSDLYGVTPQQLRDQSWVDPEEVRAEVLELLRIAREARDQAPWDHRIHRFYEMVFPQMTRWLPADEAERLCLEFGEELERLESLLPA
jgi:hypothetical protein